MIMVEVHSFATIFEGKAVKPFNTVGSETTLWSDILLRFFGHFLKKAQEGICMLSTFEWLISCVRFVISFLNIMLYIVFFVFSYLPEGDTCTTLMNEYPGNNGNKN